MSGTAYMLWVLLLLTAASLDLGQECLNRNEAAVAAEGRQCNRPCSQDRSCERVNRECICDGVCGWSCRRKNVVSQSCGMASSNPHGRVVGGVDADRMSWPWMGSLRNSSGYHFCGATVINDRWAITAAHCIGAFSSIVVGDLELFGNSASRQERQVTVFAHPGFDSRSFENDVALLRFNSALTFDDKVKPVCLADIDTETSTYDNCWVTGWGHTVEGGAGGSPNVLQEAEIDLFTSTQCGNSYGSSFYGDVMICGGKNGGGTDTCQGDSGGPLVCENDDGSWALVGIISWGIGCARPDNPGVYARVSQYEEFISSMIESGTCSHIEDQEGREVTSRVRQEYSHGLELTIRCSQDRVLNGAVRSTCNDGSWDPPLGSCVESVALGATTDQSSTNYNGFSRLAVDGSTSTRFYDGSCIHTDPDDAGIHWWYVDLGSAFTIREIRIYNREDSETVKQRLIGSNVRVGSNTNGAVVGNALVTTVTHHDIETNPMVIRVGPSIEGRIVSIDNNGILNFCEVQVFGDVTDTSCGNGCIIPMGQNVSYYRDRGNAAHDRLFGGDCYTSAQIYLQCDDGLEFVQPQADYYSCVGGVWSTGNALDTLANCVPTCRLPQDTGPVLYFTSLGSPASFEHQFYEGDSITTRCSDPRMQRFVGSRVRQCSGGRWDPGLARCDSSAVRIEVGNTVLQEIAPNGTIFVSTVPRLVWINCRDQRDRVQRRPVLREGNTESYAVEGETASSRILSPPPPRDSATFTCRPWRENQLHSIHVIFKDIRCSSPPRSPDGWFDHTKANANMFARDVYLFRETVTLQCRHGYQPSAAGASTCNYEGEWTPPLPACVRTVE